MNEFEFRGSVRDGKFVARDQVWRVLRQLEGKYISVKIRELTKRRSLKQNAYHWGVVIPQIKEEMFEAHGDTVSDEDVHEFLKAEIGGFTKRIFMKDGNSRVVTKSSSKLSTKEWEEWMEKVRAFAARHGVIIQLPNEETNND